MNSWPHLACQGFPHTTGGLPEGLGGPWGHLHVQTTFTMITPKRRNDWCIYETTASWRFTLPTSAEGQLRLRITVKKKSHRSLKTWKLYPTTHTRPHMREWANQGKYNCILKNTECTYNLSCLCFHNRVGSDFGLYYLYLKNLPVERQMMPHSCSR